MVSPRSVSSDWVSFIDDLLATVATADELLDALSYGTTNGQTNVIVRETAGATRALFRAAYDISHDAITTSPVCRFFGEDNAGFITRLDNVNSNGVGKTLTIDPNNDLKSTTDGLKYGDPIDLTGIDLLACAKIIALVETAPDFTGSTGSNTKQPFLEGKMVN